MTSVATRTCGQLLGPNKTACFLELFSVGCCVLDASWVDGRLTKGQVTSIFQTSLPSIEFCWMLFGWGFFHNSPPWQCFPSGAPENKLLKFLSSSKSRHSYLNSSTQVAHLFSCLSVFNGNLDQLFQLFNNANLLTQRCHLLSRSTCNFMQATSNLYTFKKRL